MALPLFAALPLCVVQHFAFGNTPLKTHLPALRDRSQLPWYRFIHPAEMGWGSHISVSPFPSPVGVGSIYLGLRMNPSLKAICQNCTNDVPYLRQIPQLEKYFANGCAGWLLPPSLSDGHGVAPWLVSQRGWGEGSVSCSDVTGHGKEQPICVQGLTLHAHYELFAAGNSF